MADYAVDLVRCASEMIPYLETQLEWGLGGGWWVLGGGWWKDGLNPPLGSVHHVACMFER